MSRLRSGQWLALTAGGLLIAALVGVLVCLIALHRLTDAREQVVDRIDPARVASQLYLTALVDQESGIRGYQVGGTPDYLQPYDAGGQDAVRARTRLEQLAATGKVPHLAGDLGAVALASTSWHLLYADPSILTIRAEGKNAPDIPPITTGKQLFDGVRAAFATMQDNLIAERANARTRLRHAAALAEGAVIFTAVLIVLASLAAGLVLRRVVALPLSQLARDARRVARGEFGHVVAVEGPKDIQGLSTDVESMRQRIISELDSVNSARTQLEEQTQDLQRSNAELEQFAYVASHDLQEPLRKVASFTGMLQHRYQGQLDERADQYIEFAVDGAKRMQRLIQDLLGFSRVVRTGNERVDVDLERELEGVLEDLSEKITETGASITHDPLPVVVGERALLHQLLANLLGNALKFRDPERAPAVHVGVLARDTHWEISVEDNGIGIDPQYAERVFVIFQRLHAKDVYEGTGIGLALCKRIVEYHGGRIWIEPRDGGTTIRFTLAHAYVHAQVGYARSDHDGAEQ